LISQDQSEFALHAKAILGLPIKQIHQFGASASAVIMGDGQSKDIRFNGLAEALDANDSQLRLFSKPDINGQRRLGVALNRSESIEQAVSNAKQVASKVKVIY
jgi:phosphoribosylglycinamide formyltransferase 2